MKIYLDDVRPAPAGWTLFKNPLEVIGRISLQPAHGNIEVISLDFDLGLGEGRNEINGDYVTEWLEYEIHHFGLLRIGHCPELLIHSANPVGRTRMRDDIASIKRLLAGLDH